jgi:hypothetical protein
MVAVAFADPGTESWPGGVGIVLFALGGTH